MSGRSRRLLVLGDSITLGATEVWGDAVLREANPTYVDVLREALSRWTIVTEAALHRTTGEALALVGGLLGRDRPEVVVVMLGGNDADLDWRRFVGSRGRRVANRVEMGVFETNLRAIALAVRDAGAHAVLADVPSMDVAARARWIGARLGLDVAGMVQSGGGQAEVDRRRLAYVDAVNRVARETGAGVVSWDEVVGDLPIEQRFGPDGVHPGAAAHPLLAAAVVGQVEAVATSPARRGARQESGA